MLPGARSMLILFSYLVDHVAFWMPVLVLTVAVDLDELF